MGDGPGPTADPLTPLPRPHPKLAVRVINGEAMILTPHDSVLHTLDAVATRIWELMAEHGSEDALVAAIVAEFEVDAATAREDLRELLADMAAKQIVVPG